MSQANPNLDPLNLNIPVQCSEDGYCRLCLFQLEKNIFTNVFFTFSNSQLIADVIKDFFKIEIVKDDTFSKLICAKCLNKLVEIFNFKVLVTNSDQKLRDTICEEAKDDVKQEFYDEICIEDTKLVEQIGLKDLSEDSDINDEPDLIEIGSSISEDETDKEHVFSFTIREKSKNKTSDEPNASSSDNFCGAKCKVCNKSFASLAYMKSHMYHHNGLYPFRCSICNQGCISQAALKRHSFTHQVKKTEICEICKKCFRFPGNLKAHQKMCHADGNYFECRKCKFKFKSKSSLTEHLSRHRKKKRYICQYCKAEFARPDGLKNHLKNHRLSDTPVQLVEGHN